MDKHAFVIDAVNNLPASARIHFSRPASWLQEVARRTEATVSIVRDANCSMCSDRRDCGVNEGAGFCAECRRQL